MMHARRLLGWCCLLLATLAARPAAAQLFGYDQERPRAVQSISASYALVDFDYIGGDTISTSFAFEHPAIGLVYTRPNLELGFVYGRDDARGVGSEGTLSLLDVSLATWGIIGLSDALSLRTTRLGIPIMLFMRVRRASRSEVDEAIVESFEITSVGLGTGLALTRPLGRRVLLEARVTPGIALAQRALGDTAGSTRSLDAGLQLHVGPLMRGYGLTLGYGFRWQRWDLSSSDFDDLPDDFFDYRGTRHTISLGVNW